MNKLIALALVAVFSAGAAGCGEKPQTVRYEHGKFRGKPDTQPWDNAPSATSSSQWKKGDEATWENGLRQRTTTQNEYDRIGR